MASARELKKMGNLLANTTALAGLLIASAGGMGWVVAQGWPWYVDLCFLGGGVFAWGALFAGLNTTIRDEE